MGRPFNSSLHPEDAEVLRDFQAQGRSMGKPGSPEARPYHRLLRNMVRHLRGLGYSGDAIGEVLGVSRQRVHQLHAKSTDCWWPYGVPAPRPPAVFLGMPKVAKRPELYLKAVVPEHVARKMRRLQRQVAHVNGGTPADDPRRRAGDQLARLYADLLNQGYLPQNIADAAGVTRAAVTSMLARRGYRDACPSQAHQKYRGRATGGGRRPPAVVEKPPVHKTVHGMTSDLKELWG